jgi:glycosyltransferase involved in cell wall biosynthesis
MGHTDNHAMIDVLCCTYGRTRLLNEAIECFLRQDFTDSKMIVFNDCPLQTLSFAHDRVTIINKAERNACYGDTLNHILSLATSRFVSVWDDDDLYLPQFLSSMAALLPRHKYGRAAKPRLRWVDSGHRLYRVIPDNNMNCVIAEKSLLIEEGGFNAVNYNVEMDLLRRLVKHHWLCGPGKETYTCPQYVYRLATGRTHVTDVKNESARDRLHSNLLEEIDAGREKTGPITLLPGWEEDYVAKAEASWRAVMEAA